MSGDNKDLATLVHADEAYFIKAAFKNTGQVVRKFIPVNIILNPATA